jgi:hypothetical protein
MKKISYALGPSFCMIFTAQSKVFLYFLDSKPFKFINKNHCLISNSFKTNPKFTCILVFTLIMNKILNKIRNKI